MMDDIVCYTCVTNGYDAVSPVADDWRTKFVLFHDGSVTVPPGWRGVRLSLPGIAGIDLNRFAKMLPHRLGLPGSRSLYIDGNMFFRKDPYDRIVDVLGASRVAAMGHPEQDCAYADIRRTLRLGFVWPRAAHRAVALLRELGVPAHAGLFECGILYRQHEDATVVTLGETWWRHWQIGYPRDQALMIAAAYETGTMPASLGRNDVRDPDNPLMGMRQHRTHRSRRERLPRRLASEAFLYRSWAHA
jgi:hypothetical protein